MNLSHSNDRKQNVFGCRWHSDECIQHGVHSFGMINREETVYLKDTCPQKSLHVLGVTASFFSMQPNRSTLALDVVGLYYILTFVVNRMDAT